MPHPPVLLSLDARVRAAWQTQLAAAVKTPGLLHELIQKRVDLLPRFAAQYQHLRALPRRVRRALQRQMRRSLAGVALLLALGQEHSLAETINVTGGCTLVDAITAANSDTATGGCPAGSGTDTIILQPGSVHTLTTVNNYDFGPSGLPVITSAITIEGNGSTIERASDAPVFRLAAVGSEGNLTLDKVTLRGGVASGNFPAERGGGLLVFDGALTLMNSTVSENTASVGGGLVLYSFLPGRSIALMNSTISGNTAASHGGGFWVYTSDHIVQLVDCTVTSNSAAIGGGVFVASGGDGLRLTHCLISGNTAVQGSGVFISGGSGASIDNSTISHHVGAGVAFDNDGRVRISDSSIYGNGQGVELNTDGHGDAEISGSAIFANGVGVRNRRGEVSLTNSTIARNANAGLENYLDDANATLAHCTVVGNGNSGILNHYNHYSSVVLTHSVIAGNSVGSVPDVNVTNLIRPGVDQPVTIQANKLNLFGSDGKAGVDFLPGPTDIIPAAGVLLSDILNPILADNGGPTRTHALVVGSPAVDAIVTTDPSCTGQDQRGVVRPQGSGCDIGAFEGQVVSPCTGIGDGDSDGVCDDVDLCFGNNATGDSDSDGICGNLDVCRGDDATGDDDGDKVCNDSDVCPGADDLIDPDADGLPSGCDNCPFTANPDQQDTDSDGQGDVCDGDFDNDGVPNEQDNCLHIPNPDQTDTNTDSLGDACTHDVAILKLTAPKTVTLTTRNSTQSSKVTVQLQNQSPHDETIAGAEDLAALVHLTAEALDTPNNCPDLMETLVYAQLDFPLVLASKKKVTVSFEVVFTGECVPDPFKTTKRNPGHEDYRLIATVDHSVLAGQADTDPGDDVCPRTVTPPFRIDPNPDGTIKDRGCGAKKPDGALGAEVLLDVVDKR